MSYRGRTGIRIRGIDHRIDSYLLDSDLYSHSEGKLLKDATGPLELTGDLLLTG